MHNKDFNTWNKNKKKIHYRGAMVLYREREIWWCAIGVNVGVEADGKNGLFARPVIVFRKFNKDMFWALPLTSQPKPAKPFYFAFTVRNQRRTAILSQMRLLSSKRLIRRMGKMNENQLRSLTLAMSELVNKTDPFRGPQVPNGNK